MTRLIGLPLEYVLYCPADYEGGATFIFKSPIVCFVPFPFILDCVFLLETLVGYTLWSYWWWFAREFVF